jgi:acetoin utilization protein AcuB
MCFESFVLQMPLNDPGGIIEIDINNKDYSLTEISRIIENENAKITCLYISNSPNEHDQKSALTLKLDISQISNVVNALGRYGYEVTSYHAAEPVANLEKDRYELLMKYLGI